MATGSRHLLSAALVALALGASVMEPQYIGDPEVDKFFYNVSDFDEYEIGELREHARALRGLSGGGRPTDDDANRMVPSLLRRCR